MCEIERLEKELGANNGPKGQCHVYRYSNTREIIEEQRINE
jgi:hypothetical protein